MLSLIRVARAATASVVAPRFYNSLYRQLKCSFAAQLRFACDTTTPENGDDKSNELPARCMGGRTPLPPWSESEQRAVRRFWEGLTLAPQRVASLITYGKTLSLFRNPKEMEQRLHALLKLIPGVKTTAVAHHTLLQRVPKSLADNLLRLKALLSISDKELGIMLRKAPNMLSFSPEFVAANFAGWQTLLALDHAQMVALLKKSPGIVLRNNTYTRSQLQVFLEAFESCRLGGRHLAMQIFMYHPTVVVLMSCERIQTRCMRLAESTEVERSKWPLSSWYKLLTCSDNVLDRLSFCRQHAVDLADSTALVVPAASWRKRFPDFDCWQAQELAEARKA